MIDLWKSVNWNDGEDITFGDLNDNQRFLAAKLNDQVLAKLIGSPTSADPEFGSQQGANVATSWAYALSVGGGNPKQGSANNKVKIGAGTLLQKVGAADGNDATLLAYTFDGTTEVTLANGDATHPRVDMIQMKLELVDADLQARDFQDAVTGAKSSQNLNKKHRVQCTLSVKSGAPAVSPIYPTPDAGYVPIACIVVGTNYVAAAALKYVDTAGAVAVLHDVRMPINIRPSTVGVRDPFVHNATLSTLLSSDAANDTAGNTHTRSYVGWLYIADPTPVYTAIPFLEPGDVVTGWSVDLTKSTDNTATVHGDIVYRTSGGETSATGAAQANNSNAPGPVAFSDGVHPFTVITGRQYYFKFTPGNSVTPGADQTYDINISYKRLGVDYTGTANGAILMTCPAPRGRLIALAASSANGSHTANKARLTQETPGAALAYLADVSGMTETGATPTKHELKMADLEAVPLFVAGPTVVGNGTHAPPIWGNGKRAYEEALSLGGGSTTPSRLGISFTYPAPLIDVYDTTFYMAEGL